MEKMTFFIGKWHHQLPNEPSTFLVALNEHREELSRYEFYADGTYGFCNDEIETGGAFRSEESYPSIEDINSSMELDANELTYTKYSTILFNLVCDAKIRKHPHSPA